MNYKKLGDVIAKKPFAFFAVFFGYIALNGVLNKTYITVPTIFSAFPVWFGGMFVFVNFLFVPLLVSLTVNLSFEKVGDLKVMNRKRGLVSFIGMFVGLLGGACPGCFVGLFPAVLGLFGAAVPLSVLPLYGFEIQLLSAGILIGSLHYLTRKTVCLVKAGKA
ncbi:MAG: hypothetical protein PF542_01190 [Nanoarchaeota archaeon]|jgi:hypothetical protein|nr:hypothetical protein [Nanoarchaeota archaeon]